MWPDNNMLLRLRTRYSAIKSRDTQLEYALFNIFIQEKNFENSSVLHYST